jgi:hypothetical protein
MSDEKTTAEPSPASAGSHGEHEQALFSERSSMANAALRWCDQIGVLPVAFNVVTALFRLGLVQKPQPQPTLTDEEREAIAYFAGLGPHRPPGARARLVALLERTK